MFALRLACEEGGTLQAAQLPFPGTHTVFTFLGQNAQRNTPKEEVFGSMVSGGFRPWLWERHGEVVAGGAGNSDSHHNGTKRPGS